MPNPIDLQFTSHDDLLKQLENYAKTDVPEGTHYFHITATLLLKFIKGYMENENHKISRKENPNAR